MDKELENKLIEGIEVCMKGNDLALKHCDILGEIVDNQGIIQKNHTELFNCMKRLIELQDEQIKMLEQRVNYLEEKISD